MFFKLNDEFFNKNKNLVPVRLFAIKIKTKNDEYDEKSKIHDMTDGNFFQIKIPYKIHQEKLKIFNISYRSQRIIEIYINDIPDLTNKKEYIDYIDQLKKFDPIKKLIELIDTININNFTSKEYNDEENINKFLNIFNELLQNKNFIEQLSPK